MIDVSKVELTMKEKFPAFRYFRPANCLLSSGRVLAVEPEPKSLAEFDLDLDLDLFSHVYHEMPAAVFLLYDDAQACVLNKPANSYTVCVVEGSAPSTYFADYFDLTPAEVEEVNAFFAED